MDTVFFCASKYNSERRAILKDMRSESKKLLGSKKTIREYHKVVFRVIETFMADFKNNPKQKFDLYKFDETGGQS